MLAIALSFTGRHAGAHVDLRAKLEARWKQPVIVENKPGASGVVGTERGARHRQYTRCCWAHKAPSCQSTCAEGLLRPA